MSDNIVESIYTPLLKEYGLSEKDTFTQDEFSGLETIYALALSMREKENEKASAQMILANATDRLGSVTTQIADIGTLPETQPESLSERDGWVSLKKQKDTLDAESVSLQGTITTYTDKVSVLSGEITSIKETLGITE